MHPRKHHQAQWIVSGRPFLNEMAEKMVIRTARLAVLVVSRAVVKPLLVIPQVLAPNLARLVMIGVPMGSHGDHCQVPRVRAEMDNLVGRVVT